MARARINIIVAVGTNNRAIGKKNTLLWRISDDLKRFKQLTMGHPIIMGRKTFESIGRALPGRTNIVMTRDPHFKPEGIVIAGSLEEALRLAQTLVQDNKKNREIFIIGGGEIYRQVLPLADTLYLTLVASDAEGDVFFPDWRAAGFTKEISREEHTDEKTDVRYVWVNVERAKRNKKF